MPLEPPLPASPPPRRGLTPSLVVAALAALVLLGALAAWLAAPGRHAGSPEPATTAASRASEPAPTPREPGPSVPVSPSLSSETPTARSIERAARYLTGRPLRGDEGWFLGQAALSLGGDYPDWAGQLELHPDAVRGARLAGIDLELRLWEARQLPPPDLPALPRPDVEPVETDGSAEADPVEDARRLLDVLTLTLRCEKTSSADGEELLDKLGGPASRDLLAGQLWALVMASARECLDPSQVQELRPSLAARVYGELLGCPRMTDLTATRMAVLCAAGVCSWIPDSYFETLISHQNETGRWQVETVSERPSESRVAALGLYALARRVERERGP